jgi:hypothetical protein
MATPNSLQNSEVVVDTAMLRLFSRFDAPRRKHFCVLRIFFRVGER